jgi:hypothetical protein
MVGVYRGEGREGPGAYELISLTMTAIRRPCEGDLRMCSRRVVLPLPYIDHAVLAPVPFQGKADMSVMRLDCGWFTKNPERRVTGSWRFSSSFSSLAIILLPFPPGVSFLAARSKTISRIFESS